MSAEQTGVNGLVSDTEAEGARRAPRSSRRAIRQAERAAEREAILTGQQPLLTRREMRRLREEAKALQAAVDAGEITEEQARALQDPLAEQPDIDRPGGSAQPQGAAQREDSSSAGADRLVPEPSRSQGSRSSWSPSDVDGAARSGTQDPAAYQDRRQPAGDLEGPRVVPDLGDSGPGPLSAPSGDALDQDAVGPGSPSWRSLTADEAVALSELPTGLMDAVDLPIAADQPWPAAQQDGGLDGGPAPVPTRSSLRERLENGQASAVSGPAGAAGHSGSLPDEAGYGEPGYGGAAYEEGGYGAQPSRPGPEDAYSGGAQPPAGLGYGAPAGGASPEVGYGGGGYGAGDGGAGYGGAGDGGAGYGGAGYGEPGYGGAAYGEGGYGAQPSRPGPEDAYGLVGGAVPGAGAVPGRGEGQGAPGGPLAAPAADQGVLPSQGLFSPEEGAAPAAGRAYGGADPVSRASEETRQTSLTALSSEVHNSLQSQQASSASSPGSVRRPIVRIPAAAQGVRTVDSSTGELSAVQPLGPADDVVTRRPFGEPSSGDSAGFGDETSVISTDFEDENVAPQWPSLREDASVPSGPGAAQPMSPYSFPDQPDGVPDGPGTAAFPAPDQSQFPPLARRSSAPLDEPPAQNPSRTGRLLLMVLVGVVVVAIIAAAAWFVLTRVRGDSSAAASLWAPQDVRAYLGALTQRLL